MPSIYIFKLKTARLEKSTVAAAAKELDIAESIQETDEVLAANTKSSTLIYAQPGSRFAGLFSYKDYSQGIADVTDKVVTVDEARAWSDAFVQRFALQPKEIQDERIRLDYEVISRQPEAVSFDGRERSYQKISSEIVAKIALNGIQVTGPRARLKITFKANARRPAVIHRGLWDEIQLFEERELVRENDIAAAVKDRLAVRGKDASHYKLLDIRLAYFATEYTGGPDLLKPYYFVEVEFFPTNRESKARVAGPRQTLWLPAYR